MNQDIARFNLLFHFVKSLSSFYKNPPLHNMSGTFQRLQKSLNSAKESASQKLNDVTTTNEKILNMWPNTIDTTKTSNRMTTDHGVKIQDTDHWLRVVSEKQQGPSLLEDQIAREKVHRCGSLLVLPPSGALRAVFPLIEEKKTS